MELTHYLLLFDAYLDVFLKLTLTTTKKPSRGPIWRPLQFNVVAYPVHTPKKVFGLHIMQPIEQPHFTSTGTPMIHHQPRQHHIRRHVIRLGINSFWENFWHFSMYFLSKQNTKTQRLTYMYNVCELCFRSQSFWQFDMCCLVFCSPWGNCLYFLFGQVFVSSNYCCRKKNLSMYI